MAGDQEDDVFQPGLHRIVGRLQLHFEATTFHAQTLHGLGNGLGQQRCDLGTRL